MKKILLFASALAGLFLAGSCQRENLEPVGGNTVTYTVQLADAVGTKAALGDDISAVDQLVYEVWRTQGTKFEAFDAKNDKLLYQRTAKVDDGVATIELEFVNDQNFIVLFWAQTERNGVYDATKLTEVKITSPDVANNPNAQAFVGRDFVRDCVSDLGGKVILTRPVAQLNIGTTYASLDAFNPGNEADVTITGSSVKVTGLATSYNIATLSASAASNVAYEYNYNGDSCPLPTAPLNVNGTDYKYVAMNYVGFPANDGSNVTVTYVINTSEGDIDNADAPIENVPVKANYRTNIIGNLITSKTDYIVTLDKNWDAEYNVEGDNVTTNTYVTNADEFNAAFYAAFAGEEDNNVITLSEDINLNDLISTRTTAVEDPSYTLTAGKTLTIDLNGKKLSATSAQVGKNYNMFDVRGTLTVKNGTIEYEHVGENMGWNSSTNIFNVTAGGVLNLKDITAKNLGGSDMGFVAHLNNWGEVTLNAENCTLESNYVPVRVFNSGYDMNNVTIKNSTLEGGSAAFWVHNYTAVDFGSEAKAEAQKALLNLNIYNQGNKFTPDVNGIRYGFTNSVRSDAYGITKTVSEDGTVVTLGSVVENGLVRRGVAGTEENTTITKAIVGEGITTLYDRTFRRFYALETVELPSTLTTIGAAGSGVFQSCKALKSIVLPESVAVLGEGTFVECIALESINIPASITRIENNTFKASGIKSIEFHEGVTYFGAQAFRDCKQLTEVIINAPEFTMESNTFGIMAAPFTPMTIYVANTAMKDYVGSKLTAHAKTYITVVAPEVVNNTSDLQNNLAEGKNVVLANDLTITPEEMTTAPYGNKMALSHKGGVFNGNGNALSVTANGDNYVVMTNGGTIKNLDIDRGFRGIVLMYPNQDVYVDNVNIGVNDEVCYTINTAEGDGTHSLYVSNSELNGWCSIGTAVKDVTFTNCTFGQGKYYTNVDGRLVKPYVDAIFDSCDFCSMGYLDLSAFVGTKVTLKNCTVNGVKLTAQNWTSLVAPESTCSEGQISIELKNGTYMTADNVADYIVFE